MLKEVVIVSGVRTAVGDFLGSLKDVPAVQLGVACLKEAIARIKIDPTLIEEVVGGTPDQAGGKSNMGRQVAIFSDCGVDTVASTINQQCVSSMRASEILSQEIMLGKIEVGAAVGMESMSNIPYYLMKARGGYRMANGELVDGMFLDGLIDAFNNYHMGVTAENVAKLQGISREAQDEFALLSHQRACASINNKTTADEIVGIEIDKGKKGKVLFNVDEHPRQGLTIEDLQKLKPVFQKDGTVTAGNASGLNDGGSALIMMSADKAKDLGVTPLARVVATGSAAVDPKIMGMGPVPSIAKTLQFANMKMDQIDYWEINEAFAAQFLGCNKELKIPLDKINANGGGISIGHPVGQTGARLIVSLIYEMRRRKVQFGGASLCGGGGPSTSIIIEAIY
jgi:acetyl-CoA C-acetyltransferase